MAAGQLVDLAAWEHEHRDRHGQWTGGSGVLSHSQRANRSSGRIAARHTSSQLTTSENASRLSRSLAGRKTSANQQHAAARLHSAAARQTTGALQAHHQRMAAMHRGIASRTSSRSAPGGSRGPKPSGPPKPAAMRSASPAPAKSGGYGKAPTGKASESTAGRKAALASGHALAPSKPGGRPGFPVTDAAHWDKAFQAVGRAGSPARREALRSLLLKTAKEFGKQGKVKGSWLVTGQAHSATRPALELAMTIVPVRDPSDLVIVRGENGNAIIRHRSGGDELGTIRRDGSRWVATVGGRDLAVRNHQRTALADVIGTHNRSALTPQHRPAASAGEPLQPAPQQTPLMKAYGIPAIRLATPATSAAAGPRVTMSNGDGDGDDSNGLTPKGKAIFAKLKAKGWPDAKCLAFARRAQNFGGPK